LVLPLTVLLTMLARKWPALRELPAPLLAVVIAQALRAGWDAAHAGPLDADTFFRALAGAGIAVLGHTTVRWAMKRRLAEGAVGLRVVLRDPPPPPAP
jgi:hypothetical protein